ncbi:MAG: hypothetical protein V1861_00505 [Candidatus Micrarchaeota archaeon]
MVESFREREAPKIAPQHLPSIRREERELHGPLDALGRGALHLRIPAQITRPGTERAVARADLDMRVARNVSELRFEGSTPLDARFLRMLESI